MNIESPLIIMNKLSMPDQETRDRLVEKLRSARTALHKLDSLLNEISVKFDEEAKFKRLPR